MGRSVSTPRGAVRVAYASFECDEPDFARDHFSDSLDYLQEFAIEGYPSLSRCDSWIGREDHAILENAHCRITVSEYCGLVAVALVPKEGNNLAERWLRQVNLEPLAACFGPVLRKQGTFSNGEAFFQPADGVQRGELGLGFTSKEQWL